MTKNFIYLVLLTFISCYNKKAAEEVDFATTDEILQQNSDKISYKKPRDRDLVDHLYREALEQDINLMALEKRISNIKEAINDSLALYLEYVNYNNLYYDSAQRYIQTIKDSTDRKILKSYFEESKIKFENRISELTKLKKTTDELEDEILNQHIKMKLIVSEKLINVYQETKPDKYQMKSINDEIQRLLSETEKYTGENK